MNLGLAARWMKLETNTVGSWSLKLPPIAQAVCLGFASVTAGEQPPCSARTFARDSR